MTNAIPSFDTPGLADLLDASSQEQLDALAFGVIGFDADNVVQRYNAVESQAAGLSPQRVIGEPLTLTALAGLVTVVALAVAATPRVRRVDAPRVPAGRSGRADHAGPADAAGAARP